MMYLIGQLAVWLLLTALFAALAGWAFAAEGGQAKRERMQKDRERMVGELSTLAGGEGRSEGVIRPEAKSERSLAAIRESRLAEIERTAQEQRTRADGLATQLAEAQRGMTANAADTTELERLRALVAAHEEERARIVDAEVTPAPAPEEPSEDFALQVWRLRYFEKRVKYLEGVHVAAASPIVPIAAPIPEPVVAAPPTAEWRAREAEARANFLADELRRVEAAPEAQAHEAEQVAEEPASPFAANAEVDVLLRWRMLYLERRAAHLQSELAGTSRALAAPSEPVAAPVEVDPNIDRWKWRARYLESRVRYLEGREPATAQAAVVVAVAPPPPPPAPPAERPPGLPAAHAGAPDDFTLIDNISPLQQTTLYSLGIYHFDQIAAWTPANIAWVDRYLRLQGRIGEEEWLEQAADLAREGPEAARRQVDEDEAV